VVAGFPDRRSAPGGNEENERPAVDWALQALEPQEEQLPPDHPQVRGARLRPGAESRWVPVTLVAGAAVDRRLPAPSTLLGHNRRSRP
jgi:hypothetical protein